MLRALCKDVRVLLKIVSGTSWKGRDSLSQINGVPGHQLSSLCRSRLLICEDLTISDHVLVYSFVILKVRCDSETVVRFVFFNPWAAFAASALALRLSITLSYSVTSN